MAIHSNIRLHLRNVYSTIFMTSYLIEALQSIMKHISCDLMRAATVEQQQNHLYNSYQLIDCVHHGIGDFNSGEVPIYHINDRTIK